jgi:predicted DsbA family dithiol-disulfide isomerase
VKVEIWSDVVCPWCYIGKRRFEAALAQFPHRADVEVEWKAFELDPNATSGAQHEGDHAGRLARKYGMDVAQAKQMLETMTATAAAEGLEFHFERAVRANTVDAHQVIHLAGLRGVQDAMKERLLRAYFTEGEAVADRETLVRLAAEAGLATDEVRAALEDQTYLGAVRHDEQEATAFGISGVPFFVIDRKYGVSGAQPAAALLQVLEQAWADSHPIPALQTVGGDGSDAAACGPDGCPV